MPVARPRVFDSWALIAWMEGQPAAPKVRALIMDAWASSVPMWVTTVNLAEVWYITARRRSPAAASEAVGQIRALGFVVADLDWPLALQAAQYKAENPLSLADCFAAALAKQRHAELVTGDREFEPLESTIKIRWL